MADLSSRFSTLALVWGRFYSGYPANCWNEFSQYTTAPKNEDSDHFPFTVGCLKAESTAAAATTVSQKKLNSLLQSTDHSGSSAAGGASSSASTNARFIHVDGERFGLNKTAGTVLYNTGFVRNQMYAVKEFFVTEQSSSSNSRQEQKKFVRIQNLCADSIFENASPAWRVAKYSQVKTMHSSSNGRGGRTVKAGRAGDQTGEDWNETLAMPFEVWHQVFSTAFLLLNRELKFFRSLPMKLTEKLILDSVGVPLASHVYRVNKYTQFVRLMTLWGA